MQGQVVLQEKLNTALQELKWKNPAYSMRRFAKKLGLHPAALSEILNGKRRVSRQVAEAVGQKLQLDPAEMQEILKWYQGKRLAETENTKKQVAKEYIQLSVDQFKTISEWYHFGILSLAETEDFNSDPAWIAGRLGIREIEASQAIERLIRLKMLQKTSAGILERTGQDFTSSDEVANASLRKGYARDMEMATESLDRDELSERDFTSVTMAIDPEKLPLAKKMIRNFRDQLCLFLESGAKKEVYKFNSQLIPLTKKGKWK